MLSLHAGNGAPCSPSDLGDDAFLLLLRDVFHQQIVGPFQFGILIDLFQDAVADALLAIEFAHLVEDGGAFEPLAGHGLNEIPILWIFFDVGVDFGFHFRVDPVSDGFSRRTRAIRASWRCFWFCAHNEFVFGFCELPAEGTAVAFTTPTKCFRDSMDRRVHWSWKGWLPEIAPTQWRVRQAAFACRSPSPARARFPAN